MTPYLICSGNGEIECNLPTLFVFSVPVFLHQHSCGWNSLPNYPSQYGNNHNCQMRIVAPDGYILMFTYLLFDLEYQSTCTFDSFKIYDTTFADG